MALMCILAIGFVIYFSSSAMSYICVMIMKKEKHYGNCSSHGCTYALGNMQHAAKCTIPLVSRLMG